MKESLNVKGMSCEHCVRAVSEIVARVTGADKVEVDLATATVSFAAARDYSRAELARELDDAGYELI